jgi:NADH:ubiquinone oxidoreductase subunit E
MTDIQEINRTIPGSADAAELGKIEKLVRQTKGKDYRGSVLSEIQSIIGQNSGKAGSLIRILQQTQNMIGYLPQPVLRTISRDLKVPLSEIYGIASFYHFFSLKPKGKHVIQVCMGTSCYVKGGQKILDTLKKEWLLEPGGITEDGRFSLEIVRCLGACGLSPVIAVGKDIHGRVKSGNLDNILNAYE